MPSVVEPAVSFNGGGAESRASVWSATHPVAIVVFIGFMPLFRALILLTSWRLVQARGWNIEIDSRLNGTKESFRPTHAPGHRGSPLPRQGHRGGGAHLCVD